jgi:hypothetical protein
MNKHTNISLETIPELDELSNNDEENDKVNDKVNDKDSNIDLADFTFGLVNNFMLHHNRLNSTTSHMFEGIDYSDATSTNSIQEEFYKIFTEFRDNIKTKSGKNNIYDKDSIPVDWKANNSDLIDLYVLKFSGKKYFSQSLYSLLQKVTSEDIDHWVIDPIR